MNVEWCSASVPWDLPSDARVRGRRRLDRTGCAAASVDRVCMQRASTGCATRERAPPPLPSVCLPARLSVSSAAASALFCLLARSPIRPRPPRDAAVACFVLLGRICTPVLPRLSHCLSVSPSAEFFPFRWRRLLLAWTACLRFPPSPLFLSPFLFAAVSRVCSASISERKCDSRGGTLLLVPTGRTTLRQSVFISCWRKQPSRAQGQKGRASCCCCCCNMFSQMARERERKEAGQGPQSAGGEGTIERAAVQ